MRQFDENANGTEVTLQAGEVIDLALQENPTTGFKWLFKAKGEPVCAIVADDYKARGVAPGSGGTRHWRIQTVGAGTAQLELIHARPWDSEAPPARTFLMSIRAGD